MFNISQSLSFSINSEVLGSTLFFMILGVFLASSYTTFIKKFRGEFVLSLIQAGAFDEASAKSISDLGIKKSFLRNICINTKFTFSPDYFSVSSENADDIKYYVQEESIERLEAKYSNSGITYVQLLITIIAFFAIALILATAVPEILNMFNF